MKKNDCAECKSSRVVHYQNFDFTGCFEEPNKGKWVQEIKEEECPKFKNIEINKELKKALEQYSDPKVKVDLELAAALKWAVGNNVPFIEYEHDGNTHKTIIVDVEIDNLIEMYREGGENNE